MLNITVAVMADVAVEFGRCRVINVVHLVGSEVEETVICPGVYSRLKRA